MATLGDLINAVSTDTSNVSADVAAVTAATQKETADQASLATDQGTLAAALAKSGPVAMVSADGASVTIYAPASASPGYTTTTYPVGGSVSA